MLSTSAAMPFGFVAHFLAHYKDTLLALLKPLGIWGVGALALIDAASLAVPMDLILAGYVWNDQPHYWLYCLTAALGSALGALVPYFVGRAGGELFLLKRINRTRYEQLRDRFESQEFLAIMVPAMMPPPMPIKLFEFAAGVFEMRAVSFFSAIFTGRFLRFMAVALLTMKYGPNIIHIVMKGVHEHLGLLLGCLGLLLLLLVVFVLRKGFGGRKRKLSHGKLEGLESALDEDAE